MPVQINSKYTMFQDDLVREQTFSMFLDKCLYSPLTQLIKGVNSRCPKVQFERVYDYSTQCSGIDVILTEGQWITYLDEKAQLHHMNDDIKTFAFELSYVKDGVTEAGWLLDPQKKAGAYMLCWPFGEEAAAGEELYEKASVLLVPKVSILAELAKHGYTQEVLSLRDECIREHGISGKYATKCSDFYFYFSDNYTEQMINIVVRRPLLEKIAIAALTVSLDEKSQSVHLVGNWLSQSINSTLPIGQ